MYVPYLRPASGPRYSVILTYCTSQRLFVVVVVVVVPPFTFITMLGIYSSEQGTMPPPCFFPITIIDRVHGLCIGVRIAVGIYTL